MIIGIGTDLLNLKTILPSIEDKDSSFIRKIYTEKERELIESRDNRAYCYATRFAAKEAVFKAFRVHGDAFRLNDIEVLENENGAPEVFLHGKAQEIAGEKGISKVHISLSYDTDYVSAFAVAEGDF